MRDYALLIMDYSAELILIPFAPFVLPSMYYYYFCRILMTKLLKGYTNSLLITIRKRGKREKKNTCMYEEVQFPPWSRVSSSTSCLLRNNIYNEQFLSTVLTPDRSPPSLIFKNIAIFRKA